jgi:hypothetical protein
MSDVLFRLFSSLVLDGQGQSTRGQNGTFSRMGGSSLTLQSKTRLGFNQLFWSTGQDFSTVEHEASSSCFQGVS